MKLLHYGDLKKIKKNTVKLKTEIEKVPDPFIKKCLKLKFLSHYTWEQVAANIGSGTTAESLRKLCGRYKW